MSNKGYLITFTAITAFSSGIVSANEPLSGYVPTSVKDTCNVSSDTFASDWTKITLPIGSGLPIGPFVDKNSGIVYIFPADGPNFTSSTDNSDCSFFKWGTQMFMWLTSSIDDTSVTASSSQSSNNLSFKKTGVDTPFVFSSEFFYRLNADGSLTPQSHEGELALKSFNLSKSDESLDTIGQAGGNDVLFTHPNTDVSTDSSLVYYEVLTNRPFGYVADATLNNAPAPNNYSEFVKDASQTCSAIKYGFDNGFINNKGETAAVLYNLFCPNDKISITGVPTLPTSIPQLETAIDFLSMNMEVKTAWVDASTLNHPENYILQKGSIPIFSNVDGKNEMIHMWNKNADLALVGMHVVGTVKNHPEMVWATFEHINNAPNSTYYYLDKDGHTQSHTDTSSTSNKEWLLSNGMAVTEVNSYGVSYTDPDSSVNYIQPATDSQTEAVSTPSNVNRINPWGSIQGESSAVKNTNVISTSISAMKRLKDFYSSTQGLSSVDDPRFNYILTGASWGEDGVFPTGTTTTTIAGTPAMANTTMETFQQTYLQKNGENTGCFSCHGITADKSKFGVSHIFHKIKQVEK